MGHPHVVPGVGEPPSVRGRGLLRPFCMMVAELKLETESPSPCPGASCPAGITHSVNFSGWVQARRG